MRNAAASGNFCLSALVAHDVCKVNLVSGITDHSHLNLIKSAVLSALGSRTPWSYSNISFIYTSTLGEKIHTQSQSVCYICLPINISKRCLFSDVCREASGQWESLKSELPSKSQSSLRVTLRVKPVPAGTGLTTCLGCSLNSRPVLDSRWLQCLCGERNCFSFSQKSFFHYNNFKAECKISLSKTVLPSTEFALCWWN